MKALKPRPLFENRDDRAGEALKVLLADRRASRMAPSCQINGE